MDTHEANDPQWPGVRVTEDEPFRSGGKGGQNVNRRATGVRLRVTIDDPVLRERLLRLYPGSFTDEGEMLIRATEERTQEQNRRIAKKRLRMRLEAVREEPKERIPTRTPHSAKRKRLEGKQRTSEKKEMRKRIEW